ncbi:MAG: flagellin [Planctomycetaceae bacterium]
MSRIGSLLTLGSDQIRALNRLRAIGQALSKNTQRLSTLRRINSAADDPAGLVKATLLESELTAADATRKSLSRASAMLALADTTAGETVSQLQQARTLAIQSAGGTQSSSEVAANQIQIDAILTEVDNLSQTSFSGKHLLNGESGFSTSGVDTTKILDVDVLDKTTAADVTVNIDVTTQATQATNSYTGGTLTAAATVIVQGPDGTTTVSLTNGSDTQAITDAFNAATHLTGITATRVDANQVNFTTTDYGSAASISVSATSGTFNLTTSGVVKGTDAVATINGATFTGDGSTFNVNTNQLALVVEIAPTASGPLTAFTVTGEGLQFTTGSSADNSSRIGLPNLTTASLGGITGRLHTIGSGGANSLTAGKAAEAVQILDDAIADAVRGQASIGGFRKFTIDTSSRIIDKTIEGLTTSLSDIRDTDVALETSLLVKNQLLQQTAFEALSITNTRQQGVLSLLRNSTFGFRS